MDNNFTGYIINLKKIWLHKFEKVNLIKFFFSVIIGLTLFTLIIQGSSVDEMPSTVSPECVSGFNEVPASDSTPEWARNPK